MKLVAAVIKRKAAEEAYRRELRDYAMRPYLTDETPELGTYIARVKLLDEKYEAILAEINREDDEERKDFAKRILETSP